MKKAVRLAGVLALATLLAAGGCEDDAGGADSVPVPSGRVVQFHEVITNAPGTEGATARFRFVAPDLAPDQDWSADMQALCDSYALPRTDGMVPAPQQIIISIADRALPFGEAVPDAVQLFEAYAPKGDICIWEVF